MWWFIQEESQSAQIFLLGAKFDILFIIVLLKIETYSLLSKWMDTDSKLNKSKALFT